MKQLFRLLIVVLPFVAACKKDAELQQKSYPYVLTLPVSNIDSTGVRFNARIVIYGLEPITDFGFIWHSNGIYYQYSLHNHHGSTDDFSLEVHGDLIKNQDYFCQAYVETASQLIKSTEVIFRSLGSLPPEITDFFPDTVFDGMEVTLVGKYFSTIASKNEVKVNNISVEIVSFTTDTIVFIMPETEFHGNAQIILTLNHQSCTAPAAITIIGPDINGISANEAQSGTYITLTGKYFLKGGNNLKLYFNNQEAEILDTTDNLLGVIVPPPISNFFADVTSTITIVNGIKNCKYSGSFTILKSWFQHEPPPFDWNYEYGAVAHNGKGYILEINSKKLYEYRPETNHWQVISDFPGERCDRSVHLVTDDHLMILGGVDAFGKVRYFWDYNFLNNQWTQKADLPFDFYRATHFQLGNLEYIITNEAEVWTFNFSDGEFTQLNYFPVNFLYFYPSFVSNGVAYVSTIGINWQYDQQNDQWINISANKFTDEYESYNTTHFQYKGAGYVMQHGMNLYKFDTLRKKWIQVSVFPANNGDELYKTTFIIGDAVFLAVPDSQYSTGPFLFSYQEE